jgi:hypothetical protein
VEAGFLDYFPNISMNDCPTSLVKVRFKAIWYRGLIVWHVKHHLFDFLWCDGSHEGNVLVRGDEAQNVLNDALNGRVVVLLRFIKESLEVGDQLLFHIQVVS